MSLRDYLPPLLDDRGDFEHVLAETKEAVLRVFHELSDEIAALTARVAELEARDGRG